MTESGDELGGASAGAEGESNDDETALRVSRAFVRCAQGLVFAFGAPLGWLIFRMLVADVSFAGELSRNPWLYAYLSVGTAIAFGTFGYLLGRNEDVLTHLARRYRTLSIRDDLTGLYNSRYFWDRLDAELHRGAREDQPTGLLLIDLDHFKEVNDQWGHRFGDRVLAATGEHVEHNCRRSDMAARVGGEEFAVLLPSTDEKQAARVGERIRRDLESHVFEPEEGETFRVTLSVGVAVADPAPDPDPERLYEQADEALYYAKEHGRNLLESSSEVGLRDEVGS